MAATENKAGSQTGRHPNLVGVYSKCSGEHRASER